MKKLPALISAFICFTGCGGKSDATGEVIPLEKVCAYEKWKTVAIEGYLSPQTMVCERVGRKKTGQMTWCDFRVYAKQDLTGASITVRIPTTNMLNAKNNSMEQPPSRMEDLRIYDNDGNPIPLRSKIRVYGELPKSDICEFGLIKRLDRFS